MDRTQYPHGESNVWTLMRRFHVLCRNFHRANQEPISSKNYIATKDGTRKGEESPEYAIVQALEVAERRQASV